MIKWFFKPRKVTIINIGFFQNFTPACLANKDDLQLGCFEIPGESVEHACCDWMFAISPFHPLLVSTKSNGLSNTVEQ